MERQIPRGPKDLKCPFWQKAMSLCCHTCPLWVSLRGKNAQGVEIDEWSCAMRFIPDLMLEIATTNRSSADASIGVRNVLTSLMVQKLNQDHQTRIAQDKVERLGKPTTTRN